jgi:polygalacturonase
MSWLAEVDGSGEASAFPAVTELLAATKLVKDVSSVWTVADAVEFPSDAVMVAVPAANPWTGAVTLFWPAGMITNGSGFATPVLLLSSATRTSLEEGAANVMVTVPVVLDATVRLGANVVIGGGFTTTGALMLPVP